MIRRDKRPNKKHTHTYNRDNAIFSIDFKTIMIHYGNKSSVISKIIVIYNIYSNGQNNNFRIVNRIFFILEL